MSVLSHWIVRKRIVAVVVMPLVLLAMFATSAQAQREPLHYFHSADMPPGAIGRGQIQRGGPMPGYFQPVEIRAPQGTLISLAVNGHFSEPQKNELRAAMLLGEVYRLKLGAIPLHEDTELFPTIELVNRLHPPPGQETRFPIPVYIDENEIELAISGRYVQRVIYLEDPRRAFPLADDGKSQRYFEVRPDQDPLKEADELGRPMAILRIGSRVPDLNTETTRLGFSYGSPPSFFFQKPPAVSRDAGLERQPQPAELKQTQPPATPAAPLPTSQRFPRLPVPGEQPTPMYGARPAVMR